MKRKVPKWSFTPLILMFCAAMAVMTALSAFFIENRIVFWCELAVLILLAVVSVWRISTASSGMYRFLRITASRLSSKSSDVLDKHPMPVMMAGPDGSITWYNEAFRISMLKGRDVYGQKTSDVLTEEAESSLAHISRADVVFGSRMYTVYQSSYTEGGEQSRVLYFFDDTDLKQTAEEYRRSRPVVMMVAIDSVNDMSAEIPESQIASMTGTVEQELEKFASSCGALMRKLVNGRYILILEEKNFGAVLEGKFGVLDSVRALSFGGERTGLTLSIGVGRGGASVNECEASARQALDMAFGRGGDQAAVKGENGYEFFGGVSKGVEKRTKVRTRVIASAIREFINAGENVLIMGHKFSDLDCLGSAYALWRAVTNMGKNARIVVSRKTTLAGQLLSRIDAAAAEEGCEIAIEEESALAMMTKKTLLIIVDTHRPSVVESEALYKVAAAVIVIDHHRKTVDHIGNAAVFYHEPYSSSACEMVAELLPYMGNDLIGRGEAEALLSGIMLDTKNYVLKTGVRTFEASGYLRSLGADPVAVKKMFSGSIEGYRQKSELVASAEIYMSCAITGSDAANAVPRVVAAQAADELLSIDGVDASFVIFKAGNKISISARSLGEVNVQLIMEALGGGGHLTMAATQLDTANYEDARQLLMSAIRSNRKEV